MVGNRIYQFARQGEREVMMAIDADSGKVLWETGHTAAFTPMSAAAVHGPGPKSTPVFSNGRLYSIGMTGIVTAYDAASGKQMWQKPGSPVVPMYTTHAFSPIVNGQNVIFHLGGHDEGAITAFDVNTGDVRMDVAAVMARDTGHRWWQTFGGTRQIVTITQGKLVGVDVASGALLWERPFVSPNFTNSTTPIVAGDLLVVSSGNGPPTSAYRVSKKGAQWVVETAWENADSPDAPQRCGRRGRRALWHLHAKCGSVLRRRREDGEDALDIRGTPGRTRGDRALGRSALQPGRRWRARGRAQQPHRASSRCIATRCQTPRRGRSRPIQAIECS